MSLACFIDQADYLSSTYLLLDFRSEPACYVCKLSQVTFGAAMLIVGQVLGFEITLGQYLTVAL